MCYVCVCVCVCTAQGFLFLLFPPNTVYNLLLMLLIIKCALNLTWEAVNMAWDLADTPLSIKYSHSYKATTALRNICGYVLSCQLDNLRMCALCVFVCSPWHSTSSSVSSSVKPFAWDLHDDMIFICMYVSNGKLCSEFAVNEGGIKQASNSCPDPGEPENGKRIGNDFR